MLGLCTILLSVLCASVALQGAAGWPSSWASRAHRRAVSEDRDGPNQIDDEEARAGPYAPGSYKLSQGANAQADNLDETEESMSVPNFRTNKVIKQTGETTFSTVGSSRRMGPRHLKSSKTKRALPPTLHHPKPQRRATESPVAKVGQAPSTLAKAKVEGKSHKNRIQEKSHLLVNKEKSKSTTTKPTPTTTHTGTTKNGSVARVVKKREGKMSRDEQRRLMGELGDILKDDPKTEQKKIPPDVKRETKEDVSMESSREDELEIPRKSLHPSDRKAFDEWLRNEYFRTMALSMSAKRKRNSPLVTDMRKKRKVDFDTNDLDIEGDEDEEPEVPESFDPELVQDRLQMMENAILTEAVEKIIEKARDNAMAEAAGEEVSQRISEAFYLERLQKVLEERYPSEIRETSHQHGSSRHRQAVNPRQVDKWGSFSDENNFIEGEFKKRNSGNLVDALNVMAPTDEKRQPEPLPCPELRLLTSDCSGLEDVLPPESTISNELQHICNIHEVCYTCGEAFGLSATSCDNHFLRESALLCSDDEDCQPQDLRRLLAPLRERRVFYKRSIPPICYHAHGCIGKYLTEAPIKN